jgi:hypothetical protein
VPISFVIGKEPSAALDSVSNSYVPCYDVQLMDNISFT